jgi:CRP-like cAMP-binding protein
VTEEVEFQKGQEVIREGDPGETLYLIIEGRVAVFKQQDDGGEIELDRMDAGDYFGEMALFEDIPRTATIRTIEPSRMLMLHKQEFKEMVREYPQIALDICKALSGRIRKLHSRMTQ